MSSSHCTAEGQGAAPTNVVGGKKEPMLQLLAVNHTHWPGLCHWFEHSSGIKVAQLVMLMGALFCVCEVSESALLFLEMLLGGKTIFSSKPHALLLNHVLPLPDRHEKGRNDLKGHVRR